MFNALLAEHQKKQALQREENERARKDALGAVTKLTDVLVRAVNDGARALPDARTSTRRRARPTPPPLACETHTPPSTAAHPRHTHHAAAQASPRCLTTSACWRLRRGSCRRVAPSPPVAACSARARPRACPASAAAPSGAVLQADGALGVYGEGL